MSQFVDTFIGLLGINSAWLATSLLFVSPHSTLFFGRLFFWYGVLGRGKDGVEDLGQH